MVFFYVRVVDQIKKSILITEDDGRLEEVVNKELRTEGVRPHSPL